MPPATSVRDSSGPATRYTLIAAVPPATMPGGQDVGEMFTGLAGGLDPAGRHIGGHHGFRRVDHQHHHGPVARDPHIVGRTGTGLLSMTSIGRLGVSGLLAPGAPRGVTGVATANLR